jgi:hypothetical protein
MVGRRKYIRHAHRPAAALFQARTRRIGLRRFLAFARVPEVDSKECLCEKGKETAEHVLLHYDNTP